MTSLYQNFEWGYTRIPPITNENHIISYKPTNWNRLLAKPDVKLRLIDESRSEEVDLFYKMTQQHREQCRSSNDRIHPLRYFEKSQPLYQCGPDYTSVYLDFPQYHVSYKHPLVLPTTYNRTINVPNLPQRSLVGVYGYGNDTRYNR